MIQSTQQRKILIKSHIEKRGLGTRSEKNKPGKEINRKQERRIRKMSVQYKERDWWFWETLLVEEEIKRKENAHEYAI